MLKNLLFIVSTLTLTVFTVIHSAYAQIDVNSATEVSLQSIKGISSAKAQAIVKERDTHGLYKDMADLAARVKGLGQKSVTKFQQQGLVIGAAVKSPATTQPDITAKPRLTNKK